MKLIRRQCSDKDAIQLRNKCNVDVKNLLSQCLNETEIVAFSKIEDIAQRLYDVICRIDKEKMKRETMDMLKNFFYLVWKLNIYRAEIVYYKLQTSSRQKDKSAWLTTWLLLDFASCKLFPRTFKPNRNCSLSLLMGRNASESSQSEIIF